MPIKKTKFNKKKMIPKKKKTKAIKPIVIITQKLPREKCCTDVTKSGEAYTIPIGFTNRLVAPEPIPQRMSNLVRGLSPLKKVSISTSTESQPRAEISTQTDKPSVATKITQVTTIPVKKPVTKKLIVEGDSDEENIVIMPTESSTIPIEASTERNVKRKYDTNKAEENKTKLLSDLYNLLLINNSQQDSLKITESYNQQSNKKIKERINSEKQLVKKI